MQPEGFILFGRCGTLMMGLRSAQILDSRAFSKIYLFAVDLIVDSRREPASAGHGLTLAGH